MTLDEAKKRLSAGKGNIRCSEVISILEELGFTVERGNRGKHYSYNHPALDDWWGSNFACPHKAGSPMNKNYITNILQVLRIHETELSKYLRKQR